MNRLILIAVPGTVEDRGVEPVVRVVVIPRLDSAETVAGTPLADWPATLGQATFEVDVDGTKQQVSPRHEAVSDVWRDFFSTLTVADAPAPVIGDAPVMRETAADATAVEATYSAVSTVSIDPTSADQPKLDEASAKELRENWQRPTTGSQASETGAGTAVEDFHQVIALLREHPAVLRKLGLVFELPIEAAALSASGLVTVGMPAAPPGLTPLGVPSRYELDADRGLVPGRSALARAGCVDLSVPDKWVTSTFEVDVAVDRLTAAATELADGLAPASTTRLPALRSAGIQLLRPGRGEDFKARRAAASRNGGRSRTEEFEPLDADDLTLGYRVDVRPRGGQWSSLMLRKARYLINEREIAELVEEGHVKPGAAVLQGGTLVAGELVARWSGWSLAVTQARPASPRNSLPFTFSWEHAVEPGSLLPLRFGRSYHLRIRLADLTGHGVALADQDQTMGTASIPYSRYEPVGAPAVTLADPAMDLGPGGDVDQLVVRADAPDYPANNARRLTPPLVGLDLAEQHGMLDGVDAATFDQVLLALEGGLPDPASGGVMVFPVAEPGAVDIRPEPAAWPGRWPKVGGRKLALRPRNGDEARMATFGDVVEVRLAPGEQVTLALSSFVTEDFVDHLAVAQWRGGGADDGVVADGRHPMATPDRRVTLMHAARRQPETPAGSFKTEQEPGGITALLRPQPPLLGADPAFTQQLQITADWTEVADDLDTSKSGVAVVNYTLARGDAELPRIEQNFGDTRHRVVRYGLACISRFRNQYRPDEDPELFVASGEIKEVSISSTARPAPPSVRAVVPGLTSTRETGAGSQTSVRAGGVLRVELDRPWRLTGEGEQLAVLVDSIDVGRDPAVDTPAVQRRMSAADFPDGATHSVDAGDGRMVDILPVDVVFTGDRWVADVALPRVTDLSYRPFVSMRVARYQAASLPGFALSEFVATDPVQLLPGRRVTVTPSGRGVSVLLEGLGPQPPNLVVATVEEPGQEATDLVSASGDSNLAWRVVGTASGSLGTAFEVPVPVPATARVRVREIETFAASRTDRLDELTQRTVFSEILGPTVR